MRTPALRIRSQHSLHLFLKYTPIALLFALTVIPAFIGVIYGMLCSVGYFSPVADVSANAGVSVFTLRYYTALWNAGDLRNSVFFALYIASTASLLSYAAAFVIALILRETNRINRWSVMVLKISLPFPHIVAALCAILFWSQSGLASRALGALGVIASQDSFPGFVYDRAGIGIILVFLWKETPFLVLVMLSIFASSGKKYETVAHSLGANRWQSIRHTALPLVTRGMLPSLLLVFTFITGAFDVPLLIGPLYPPMPSVLAYQRFTAANLQLHGEAFAVSTVICVGIMALITVYKRLEKTLIAHN